MLCECDKNYTPAQTMRILKINRATLRQLQESNVLHSVKEGGITLITGRSILFHLVNIELLKC